MASLATHVTKQQMDHNKQLRQSGTCHEESEHVKLCAGPFGGMRRTSRRYVSSICQLLPSRTLKCLSESLFLTKNLHC